MTETKLYAMAVLGYAPHWVKQSGGNGNTENVMDKCGKEVLFNFPPKEVPCFSGGRMSKLDIRKYVQCSQGALN